MSQPLQRIQSQSRRREQWKDKTLSLSLSSLLIADLSIHQYSIINIISQSLLPFTGAEKAQYFYQNNQLFAQSTVADRFGPNNIVEARRTKRKPFPASFPSTICYSIRHFPSIYIHCPNVQLLTNRLYYLRPIVCSKDRSSCSKYRRVYLLDAIEGGVNERYKTDREHKLLVLVFIIWEIRCDLENCWVNEIYILTSYLNSDFIPTSHMLYLVSMILFDIFDL